MNFKNLFSLPSVRTGVVVAILMMIGTLYSTVLAQSPSIGKLDRTILPIPEPMITASTELDARNAKAPARFEVKALAGAPNVLTDRWPTRSGFDHFYGFIGGESNQWAPAIYEDMSRVEIPEDPNYHFMTDMTKTMALAAKEP